MRKQILNYIFEIIIAICMIFMSIPFWNSLEANKKVLDNTLAASGLELSEANEDDLAVSEGSSNQKTLYVTNNSDVNSSGKLVFKYAKASLINYDYLNISVNDYTTKLSYLYYGEDDNYYLFLLDTFNLNSGEKETYNVALNTIDGFNSETQGKSYIYQIEVNYDKNI
jgi:hypothetical protein